MRKYPPKGRATGHFPHNMGFGQWRGLLVANCQWEQRYATYLQREIRTVPGRSENGGTRLGDRGLLRARAGVTAQAAKVVEGRCQVPIEGRWRFAVAGRDHPTTHARACVASSLCCGSDHRLRVSAPAHAGLRRSVGQPAGCRVTRVGFKSIPANVGPTVWNGDMKPLSVALRVVSCQRANALPTGNVMGETEWATFQWSERRWPRRCWPHCVVANGGHVSASSPVSKWRDVRRIRPEDVTESVWTGPKPPKSRQSSETQGGHSVPIWIESARVRDMCCGRTPSGCAKTSRLSHAGQTVTCSYRGLPICAKEWPKSCQRALLYCVHPTLCWLGRFQRSWHARSHGRAAPKRPRLGQKGSIEGSDPQPGTFECVFVHLCGFPLLL